MVELIRLTEFPTDDLTRWFRGRLYRRGLRGPDMDYACQDCLQFAWQWYSSGSEKSRYLNSLAWHGLGHWQRKCLDHIKAKNKKHFDVPIWHHVSHVSDMREILLALRPREQLVASHVLAGYSITGIAKELHISEWAVRASLGLIEQHIQTLRKG